MAAFTSYGGAGADGGSGGGGSSMTTTEHVARLLINIKDELMCPICLELCDDPLFLGCNHTFCRMCLIEMAGGGTAISCPYCREVTTIGAGGVDVLKRNILARNILELFDNPEIEAMISEFEGEGGNTNSMGSCEPSAPPPDDGSLPPAYDTTWSGGAGAGPAAPAVTIEHDATKGDLCIPFAELDVLSLIDSWLKGLWWLPSDFLDSHEVNAPEPRLVPAYLFNISTVAHYRGTAVKSVEGKRGKRAQGGPRGANVTRFVATGEKYGQFERIVPASPDKTLTAQAVELGPWPSDTAEPMREMHNEKFQDETNIFNALRRKVVSGERSICMSKLREDTRAERIEGFSADVSIQHASVQKILLPIHVFSITYNSDVYAGAVNGATGKVTGERPHGAGAVGRAVDSICSLM